MVAFGRALLSMSTTARAGARVLPPTISKVGAVRLAQSLKRAPVSMRIMNLVNGRGDGGLKLLRREPPAQATEPIAHEGCCGVAVVAVRHGGQHGDAELLDLSPFRAALNAEQVEGDRLDQGEALHLGPEPTRGLKRQGRAIGVADQVDGPLNLVGELEQHGEIGLTGEHLALRPSARLPIADKIGGEHAPIGLKRLDQRQPFSVRGRAAMGNDDGGPVAPVEIGDLDAVYRHLLQGHQALLPFLAVIARLDRAIQ